MKTINTDQTPQIQPTVVIYRENQFAEKKFKNRLVATLGSMMSKIKDWTQPVRLIPKAYKEWTHRVKNHHVATHVFMACLGLAPWLLMAALDASKAYKTVRKENNQRNAETSTEIAHKDQLSDGSHTDADKTLTEWNEKGEYQGYKETLHRHLNNTAILINGVNPDAQALLDSGTASVIFPKHYKPAT
ncbi:MAG: hypothetical protein QS721_08990 [Candidatus Endonucleobacter sp. (ex Gigantidas childressi)]|nr:hypothetical protein [Candidatus Endonucleobacter sp. (ex Gigantidas childressi)]